MPPPHGVGGRDRRRRARPATRRRRAKLAVLCSGEGTNLQAILDAIRRGRLRAEVALVVSDNPKAGALARARRAGVPAVCLRPSDDRSRAAYDERLGNKIQQARADWIILAGFMRILTPAFVRRFAGRILNIHPALLPAFRGAHAVRDALAYGVKVAGVTVHLVDWEVDHGPVIAQRVVPIKPGDTEQRLLARVHRVEHQLYPQVIQWAVDGRLRVRGRQVTVRGRS